MHNTNEKEKYEKGYEPFSAIVKRVENYGVDTINIANQRSKSIGDVILQIASNAKINDDLKKELNILEEEIRKIDPNNVDFTKVQFGIDKYFSPVTKYFNKVKQEDNTIEKIVATLNEGRNRLSDNNVILEIELDRTKDTVQMLELEYEVGKKIEERLVKIIDDAKNNGNDKENKKAAFYEDEVVGLLNKRLDEINYLRNLNEQYNLAINNIRNRNIETIKDVDRTKEATVSAMNMAVVVGNSLYDQSIMLNSISSYGMPNSESLTNMSGNTEEDSKIISKQIFKNDITTSGLKASFDNALNSFGVKNG